MTHAKISLEKSRWKQNRSLGAMSSTDEPVDLEDLDDTVPEEMLWDSDEDSEEGSAIDDVPLEYRLEHWRWRVRVGALSDLDLHDPSEIAQHFHFVIDLLADAYPQVRVAALRTLGKLEPTTLAQHADVVIARLEDSEQSVRVNALDTLGKLEPAMLVQHADVVIARLEDPEEYVRVKALDTLGKLEPAMLAQHADVVISMLKDPEEYVRQVAVATVCKLPLCKQPEPATFRYQVYAVFARLDVLWFRQVQAQVPLRYMLPHFVTRGVDFDNTTSLRSRLLGRLAWYRFRLRRRVKCLALYWYALQYRPSGRGHARDVEKWEQMREMSMP